ncbi:MAG: Uma2 family endonuclease [Armatimonadaceae bacterium]
MKHEYIAGEIVAMAGGKHPHNQIATDTLLALGTLLRQAGSTCDVYNSDQKVRASENGPFFYPDATVVCGEPQIDSDDCLRNPTLVVEVLSETSAEYDRGEKFRNYRQFPTLRHYLLIDQNEWHVEQYRQIEGVLWERSGVYTEQDTAIPLDELGIELPLREIYRRVSHE